MNCFGRRWISLLFGHAAGLSVDGLIYNLLVSCSVKSRQLLYIINLLSCRGFVSFQLLVSWWFNRQSMWWFCVICRTVSYSVCFILVIIIMQLLYSYGINCFLCHHLFNIVRYIFLFLVSETGQQKRLPSRTAATGVATDQATRQTTPLANASGFHYRPTSQPEMTKVRDFLPSYILAAVSYSLFSSCLSFCLTALLWKTPSTSSIRYHLNSVSL